jgi:hypothetical protein
MIKKTLLAAAVVASVIARPADATPDQRVTDYTHIFTANEVVSDTGSLDALLSNISKWLAENYDLPATGRLPQVKRATPAEVAAIRYRLPFPSIQQPPAADKGSETLAVYDDRTATIYVPQEWTGRSAPDQSVLVHEMVHHLQNIGQHRYECPQQREKLAYLAQESWLAQNGSSLEEAFGVDAFTVFVRVSCI